MEKWFPTRPKIKQSLKHNKLLCKGNLVCSNKEISLMVDIQYIILNKQKKFGVQIFLKTTIFNHMKMKHPW